MQHHGDNPSGYLPATSPSGPGLAGCRPLAALDIGYHTRRVWTLLQSVWADAGEGMQPVDPSVVGIRHGLLVLGDRLAPAELAHVNSLLATAEEWQSEACLFVGSLKTELLIEWDFPTNRDTGLFDLSGHEDRLVRFMPGRIEARRGPWDAKCERCWGELRLLSERAVAGEERLEGWWEIGFRVADLTQPAPVGAPNDRTDESVGKLYRAIDKLPDEERAWVRNALPAVPPAAHPSPGTLHEAYREFRSVLPGYENCRQVPGDQRPPAPPTKRHPSRAELPDDYEANLRVKKHLDTYPRATIREVAEAVGLSTGKVSGLDAWQQVMAKRAATKPPPRKAERQLSDGMLAAKGRHDDPADKVMQDEAIWQWLLELAEPIQRAELYGKNANERATLIELAREQFKIEHGD